jgi:hypothetical protein
MERRAAQVILCRAASVRETAHRRANSCCENGLDRELEGRVAAARAAHGVRAAASTART